LIACRMSRIVVAEPPALRVGDRGIVKTRGAVMGMPFPGKGAATDPVAGDA